MARQITGINDIPTILDQNKTNRVNEEKILSQSKDERVLNSTIECFYEDKQLADKYKKSAEEYNKEIKQLMSTINKNEFETDSGLIAKISIQKRESFIEEALLQKIKELKVPGIIKTKEYVDMDLLEDAIYNEKLDASELTTCRKIQEVVTLKVSKKKGK